MKKITLFLMLCLCLTGCKHKHDTISVWNREDWIFDNVTIKTKDGYFYCKHEKFTVDENTIGVTIYFTNGMEDTWN